MTRSRVSSVLASAALLCVVTTVSSVAQQPSGVPHTSDLSAGRVDVLANGELVVTLTASGELKGLITFKLRRTADGAVNGDWAFTLAHVDNADPATGIEPEHEDEHEGGDHEHPHRDYVTMVHRGSLAGTISNAQLSFDSAGGLSTMSASLTIARGSSEFEGATGSGQATLSALTLFF